MATDPPESTPFPPANHGDITAEMRRMWEDTIAHEATPDPHQTLRQSREEAESLLQSREASLDETRDQRLKKCVVAEKGSPERFPDYALLDRIGEGGMGLVYEAAEPAVERTIALKTLKTDGMRRDDARKRFLREALVTAALDHPSVVPVYAVGQNQDEAVFYTMKRVRGVPWREVMDERSTEENVDILLKVADAVAFAHSRGVIHRDLKPDNVMLGDYGEVLLMDWGLAAGTRPDAKAAPLSDVGIVAGTPAYMAPEMAMGDHKSIDERSDVYLLGAILFRIITNQTPHAGDTVLLCLEAAVLNEIVDVPRLNEYHDIALKAMSKASGDRYASVKEFQKAVADCRRHSESIHLSTRAAEHLEQARKSQAYEDFARALFGFEEALKLWQNNHVASDSLGTSLLAYAECAVDKGDLDLALSLLGRSELEGNDNAAALRHQAGREQRKRAAQEKRARIAGRVAGQAVHAQGSQAEKLRRYRLGMIAAAVVAAVALVVAAVAVALWLSSGTDASKEADAALRKAPAAAVSSTATLPPPPPPPAKPADGGAHR